MDLIKWLEGWYLSQCDGDWEHSYGLKIDTLDNPGWSVCINLVETNMENKQFEKLDSQRSEHDWVICRLNEGSFEGFGGPSNLGEIISTIKNWVELS